MCPACMITLPWSFRNGIIYVQKLHVLHEHIFSFANAIAEVARCMHLASLALPKCVHRQHRLAWQESLDMRSVNVDIAMQVVQCLEAELQGLQGQ